MSATEVPGWSKALGETPCASVLDRSCKLSGDERRSVRFAAKPGRGEVDASLPKNGVQSPWSASVLSDKTPTPPPDAASRSTGWNPAWRCNNSRPVWAARPAQRARQWNDCQVSDKHSHFVRTQQISASIARIIPTSRMTHTSTTGTPARNSRSMASIFSTLTRRGFAPRHLGEFGAAKQVSAHRWNGGGRGTQFDRELGHQGQFRDVASLFMFIFIQRGKKCFFIINRKKERDRRKKN